MRRGRSNHHRGAGVNETACWAFAYRGQANFAPEILGAEHNAADTWRRRRDCGRVEQTARAFDGDQKLDAACRQPIRRFFFIKDRIDGANLVGRVDLRTDEARSEEHTSELQSPYVISYAVFCLK